MLLTASFKTQTATIAGSATSAGTFALHHAARWHIVVKNVHASQTLTACRIRRRAMAGGAQSPWETVTIAVPIAAGATLSIRPDADDCSYDLELELTASGAGTGVEIDLAGV